MLIVPPLQLNDPNLRLAPIFERFVQTEFPSEDVWKNLKPVFEKIDTLRSQLNFPQINQQLPLNPQPKAQEIQTNSLTYLKYAYQLDMRFPSFSQAQPPDAPIANFSWSDSFEPKRIAMIPSLKYEILCTLYNLTIAFIIDAQNYHNLRDASKAIEAIKRCNVAIGCLKELKQFKEGVHIPSALSAHIDLGLDNLEILQHLCLGIGYGSLFDMNQPIEKEKGVDKVASLAGEAGFNFNFASGILEKYVNDKKSPIPTDYQNKLNVYLKFNAAMFIGRAAFKMHKYKLTFLDDIRSQSMGWAVSYLECGSGALKKTMNIQEVMGALSQPNKDAIITLNKQLEEASAICQQKNREIYKDPIFPTDQLPSMNAPPDWKVLNGVVHSELTQKIQEQSLFSIFLPAELMKFVHEAQALANDRQSTIDAAFRALIEKKNTDFNAVHLGFLLDIWNSRNGPSKREITPLIRQKIASFKSQGGGERLQQLIMALKDNSKSNVALKMSIQKKIEEQEMQDDGLKQMYAERWNRNPSKSINQEYLNDLKRIQNALNQATASDVATYQLYDKSTQIIQIAYLPDSEILQQMPNSINEQILAVGMKELEHLQTNETKVNICMQETATLIGNIFQFIDRYNYHSAVLDATQKNVPTNNLMAVIIEPIKQEIQKLNAQSEEAVKLIGETCAIAVKIDELRKSQSNNSQELSVVDRIGKGLEEICNLFFDLEEGLRFYQKLFDKTINLDRRVNDYVLARQFQQNELLQQISYAISKETNQKNGFGATVNVPTNQTAPVYGNNNNTNSNFQSPPPTYGNQPYPNQQPYGYPPAPPNNQYGGAPNYNPYPPAPNSNTAPYYPPYNPYGNYPPPTQ